MEKAEIRRQKSEGRNQKAEGRKWKVDIRRYKSCCLCFLQAVQALVGIWQFVPQGMGRSIFELAVLLSRLWHVW
ncbi:MAG: hypothetical protein H6667_12520 [Ardenticatenaceae bacterium]|nr:hypothetical protein [Ardenticatenaceae bacterium]